MLRKALRPDKNANITISRIRRQILSHVWEVRIAIIIFVLGCLVILGIFGKNLYKKYNLGLVSKTAYNFLFGPISQLASNNGRTNILVLGKAGGSHEGPDLTDTMMLLSVSLSDPDVKIISIPRDLWIPDIRAKVNSAFYWGNQKDPDKRPFSGIIFAKAITGSILDVPIHYAAVIDFSGFKDIIDALGGIEVNVTNSFTDYYYPIAGRENDDCGGTDPKFMCRYETLHFVQGKQFMNGEMALNFVRSRHADGIEGTDIAREARQQKVIEALKNKLADKKTFINFKKDKMILASLLKSLQTDIDYPTAAILARRIFESKDAIKSFTIPEELLDNPPLSEKYDMQFVFIPKAGNGKWEDLQKWVFETLK